MAEEARRCRRSVGCVSLLALPSPCNADVATTEPPEPLSLLRYFKPSASSGAARELSSKALDIAFWPFSDYAIDLDAEPESDEDDEHGDTDEELLADEKKGRKRQVAAMTESQQQEAWEADGTTLLDKKEVGVKLVGVVSPLARSANTSRLHSACRRLVHRPSTAICLALRSWLNLCSG